MANLGGQNASASDLCALIGSSWDCHGSATATGFLLEIFKLPRDNTTRGRETCGSYLLLPAENTWRYQTRGFLYAFGLFYCFIGLATITAKYMQAMENIVKQTRQVARKDPLTGATEIRREKIWNSTVADITLLALGTSSPQISLAIIDSIQQLGDLSIGGVGPGTLVGSAAFNLFPILAVCVLVPKRGAVRRIEKMGVFIVELVWSIWAYIWLYIMLKVSSPNRIDIWEAILTVLQFPLLILHAYAEDRGWSYVSLAFWYRKVAKWVHSAVVHGIKSKQEQSDNAEYSSDSSGKQKSNWLSDWFRYENLLPRSLQNGNLTTEVSRVSSQQGHHQADGALEVEYPSSGEVPADSPAVLLLHADIFEGRDKDFSLGEKWRAQLYQAMSVPLSKDGNFTEVVPSTSALLWHAFTFLWRGIFSFVITPADVWHGWPAFISALVCITGISAIAIQLANLLGCVSGIKNYVIAITVLASGTSWPDLVASKIAVARGTSADSGIANINTSNCINVFVGIGIPWLIQVLYNRLKLKEGLHMVTSGLSFSVLIYFITFALCWVVVMARRIYLGGELGGPRNWARASSAFFVFLWLIFVGFSCLNVYNTI
ncbi:unnamed protein product [Calypogeia fissa]